MRPLQHGNHLCEQGDRQNCGNPEHTQLAAVLPLVSLPFGFERGTGRLGSTVTSVLHRCDQGLGAGPDRVKTNQGAFTREIHARLCSWFGIKCFFDPAGATCTSHPLESQLQFVVPNPVA